MSNSIWMNDLLQLLSKYQVQIKLQYSIPKLQRYNNLFIMEDILEHISSIAPRKKAQHMKIIPKRHMFF